MTSEFVRIKPARGSARLILAGFALMLMVGDTARTPVFGES